MHTTDKFFAIFGIISFAAILMISLPILNGFVLSVLWTWFVVTTFHLSPLSVPAAIGLAYIVSWFTPTSDTEKTDWKKVLTMAIVKPIMFLLCGWVVHFFV